MRSPPPSPRKNQDTFFSFHKRAGDFPCRPAPSPASCIPDSDKRNLKKMPNPT